MEKKNIFEKNNISFIGENFKCPKCSFDYSNDPNYIFNLFLEMKEQSKKQNEPQYKNYVDIFKRGKMCNHCGCVYIIFVRFFKCNNFFFAEQLNEKIK